MEDFKDVMLAEPPARFAAAPAVHPASLESYKGILLCGRPSDGARVRDQGPAAIPFLPAGKSDDTRYLGLQPSIEDRARVEMQKTVRGQSGTTTGALAKRAALSRHRRWLVSFARAVKDMKSESVLQAEADAAAKERLRQREAEARSVRMTAAAAGGLLTETNAVSSGQAAPPPPKAASSSSKPPPPSGIKAATASAKPKWAMTEDEAMDAEFAEARDLIDFAASLDFKKFMDDYEVREALAIMRDRVKEIASEEGIDLDAAKQAASLSAPDNTDLESVSDAPPPSDLAPEAREAWLQQAQERRLQRRARRAAAAEEAARLAGSDVDVSQREAGWDRSLSTRMRTAVNNEALRLADKVLASSEAMRKIHSRASLAKLLQDASLEVTAARGESSAVYLGSGGAQAMSAALAKEPPLRDPRMASYAADSCRDQTLAGTNGVTALQGAPEKKRILTDLRKATDKAQNLPYLYRCPAI